jgi:very-short-patch-repair endonuclease
MVEDGSSYAAFISETKSLPSGIIMWQLSRSVKHGRRMVLSFRDFKRWYLQARTTSAEFKAMGVPAYVLPNSTAFYGLTAKDVIQRVSLISRLNMVGNRNGINSVRARKNKETPDGDEVVSVRALLGGIRICTLAQPLSDGRRVVLHKEDFQRFYVAERWSISRFRATGINHHVLLNSVKHYKLSAGARMERHRLNTGEGALNNTAGVRKPRVLIPEAKLRRMVSGGMTAWGIAQDLKLSHWMVRRNFAHYRIEETGGASKAITAHVVEALEPLSPGITEAFLSSAKEPLEFANMLYVAHLRMSELQFLMRSAKRALKRRSPHISFCPNTAENLLALQLLAHGIGHYRQHIITLGDLRRTVDFYFPEQRLVVEVDGSVHAIQRNADADATMTQALKQHGYKVLRIDAKLVERSASTALDLVRTGLFP